MQAKQIFKSKCVLLEKISWSLLSGRSSCAIYLHLLMKNVEVTVLRRLCHFSHMLFHLCLLLLHHHGWCSSQMPGLRHACQVLDLYCPEVGLLSSKCQPNSKGSQEKVRGSCQTFECFQISPLHGGGIQKPLFNCWVQKGRTEWLFSTMLYYLICWVVYRILRSNAMPKWWWKVVLSTYFSLSPNRPLQIQPNSPLC